LAGAQICLRSSNSSSRPSRRRSSPLCLARLFAAGDAASGLTLAKTWCVTCHIVAPNVAGGDNAPPFDAIANRSNLSPGALRAWLTDTHPPMPNLNLSNQQIDDITAYLDSLRKR
jgi:mono/diheme cytochrome c family protein